VKPVTLNVATRPFRNNALVGGLLGVIGAALVAATAVNLYVYFNYGNSYARLLRDQALDRTKIEQLEVEEKRLAGEVRARDFKKMFERGKLASDLIRRRAFSWTLLFNTLETVVPPDVVMTAIRPNIATEGIVIRIEGVAKNHGALLAFEDSLLRHAAFAKVYPTNERRLNPSLPDITFLLTCDYLPEKAVSPDLVAAGPAAGGTPAGAASPDTTAAAGATPEGAPGQAPATEAAAPAKTAAIAAGTIVGRDGLPRTHALRLPIVAPGALVADVTASAAPAPAGAAVPATAGTAATPPAAKTVAPTKTGKPAAASERAGTPAKVVSGKSGPGTAAPTAPGSSAKAPAASGSTGAPGSLATSPVAPAPASRLLPLGRPIDPNVPRTLPARQRAAVEAQLNAPHPPDPAQRLDVPLSFVQRPVNEIYRSLGEAHGVRFDFDSAVNAGQLLTINLQGRKLDDAITLLAGFAHHHVKRMSEGVYRVVPLDKDHAFDEAPVVEEAVPEKENR
jgi:hypothetical protein